MSAILFLMKIFNIVHARHTGHCGDCNAVITEKHQVIPVIWGGEFVGVSWLLLGLFFYFLYGLVLFSSNHGALATG